MATSFSHKGHHQANSQKLKKAVTCSAKSSIYVESYLFILIFINIYSIIIIL